MYMRHFNFLQCSKTDVEPPYSDSLFINRNYRVLMSVCVSVCLSWCVSVVVFMLVCVSVCVHDNSNNNISIHLKLEHTGTVVYGNSSAEFDIGHCQIKVKVMRDFQIFLHLPQYRLSSPISYL